MLFNCTIALVTATLCILLYAHNALSDETYNIPNPYNSNAHSSEEYCLMESFRPRCLKNEVVLMKSATYGRMRIGKCITSEEVAEQGPSQEVDRRFLGCSTDVLEILDQKCSGKTECEVRVADISIGNNIPCFRGLKMYLEVSYVCISIVDEARSCTVIATEDPVHIIGSTSSSKLCGTKSQPWIVEASVGKRISLTFLKTILSPSANQMEEQNGQSCYSHGIILDKIGRRNVSICGDGAQQGEKNLLLSKGNTVHIIFSHSTEKDSVRAGRLFVLRVEAVGCSDIIPPEDAWLKRNSDDIVIGCYSNRQTWRLNCEDGKWIGVTGNCSQDSSVNHVSFVEPKTKISSDEQILALVAIVGCTLAVCMAIICIGAVCLRRYHSQISKKQTYKTLNGQFSKAVNSHGTGLRFPSGMGTGMTERSGQVVDAEQMPTYSVYVGEEEFHDVNVNTNSFDRM